MTELGNAIMNPCPIRIGLRALLARSSEPGTNVFLVLEATIGFNKREDGDEGDDGSDHESESPLQLESAVRSGSPRKIRNFFGL